MKALSKLLICLLGLFVGIASVSAKPLTKSAASKHRNLPYAVINQTPTVNAVLPGTALPFRVSIEQAFQLPVGFHSGVVGTYKGLWVFIAGRTNGMHGFGPTNNFPASEQNTSIYVVNPKTGATFSRSLNQGSGLSQQQIDTLTVTSPQGYQESNTLYMTGGYGIDTATGTFGTKPVLTAFYLPGIVNWVTQPTNKHNSLAENIQQLYNPIFQITGGEMSKLGNTTQLVFGQNFDGQYTDESNGNYSNQVRRFQITQTNGHLSVIILDPMPKLPLPSFRRRDLNVVPTLLTNNGRLQYGLIAYAGVFLPAPANGVWTVPVIINGINDPIMADPNSPTSFKQAMNQYVCATASFYSKKSANMYHIFFGGISYGFFSGGTFQTDDEFPFINQITTVQMDKNGYFNQFIMDSEYPVIISTGSNPGNRLIFGAGAYFLPNNILSYPNSVISLDSIRRPTVIGYIVGGIASTVPNTSGMSDSTGSPYVFRVILTPK